MRISLRSLAQRYDTDKAVSGGYLDSYEMHFGDMRDQPVKLLELGVLKGGSLLLWQEYFQRGHIVGLDLNPVEIDGPADRIRTYRGSQDDHALLDRIGRENAPEGFDIIIDDAAHVGTLARASFQHLFPHHLRPGGVYVVEDWGTGYWPAWADGAAYVARAPVVHQGGRTRWARWFGRRGNSEPAAQDLDSNFACHNFGMVGFVKELVDECGLADITHATHGRPPAQDSLIQRMTISHGQAFILKHGGKRVHSDD